MTDVCKGVKQTELELLQFFLNELLQFLLLQANQACRPLYDWGGGLRLSANILLLQLPPNVLFTIFYYLLPKDSSPYNSSPTFPHIYSLYILSLIN